MATPVIMPKFGMAQEEATIVEWYVKKGQAVSQGDPLLSVETDKVAMDVEAPAGGVLLDILYQPGDVVPVTVVIAYLGDIGEEIQVKVKTLEPALEPKPAEPAGLPEKETAPALKDKVKATPVARRIARERGIDLALIKGTGPDGQIQREDVEAFNPELPPEPVQVKLSDMRKTIARRMQQSWQAAPHIVLSISLDMSAFEAGRAEYNKQQANVSHKASVTSLLIKAVAQVLPEHPYLNASFKENTITMLKDINIGMAVALDDGLIVPVIKRADKIGLKEITKRSKELSERAKSGYLAPDDVMDGTFTISNLGMFGVEQFSAIINPPESAILAVGSMQQEVRVVDGMLAIRPVMRMSLSVDHRVADGAAGGKFLAALKKVIEEPESLFV